MKKILSFLLAASLVLGFSAVGFAADGEEGIAGLSDIVETEPGATLDGTSEGGTMRCSLSINNIVMTGYGYEMKSPQKPESAEFTLDGKPMEAEIEGIEETNGAYTALVSIGNFLTLDITPEDQGTFLKGELKIYWEDGNASSWIISVEIDDAPQISEFVADEQGNEVNRSKLEIGKTYAFKVRVKDRNHRLQKAGYKTMTVRWQVNAGAQRIKLLGEQSESLQDGDNWYASQTYAISGNEGDLLLPFETKFTPIASGDFETSFRPYMDGRAYAMGESIWYYTIIDTVDDGSDLINIDKDVKETDSEVIVSVPTNKKISAAQFAEIQEMAAGGKPVSLALQNTSGIQMKLDIPSELPQGFLDDLAEKNNGKFDPSVNLNIPNGANRYVSAHGQWVNFMYSGRLPGKMTVTVDIPQGTFQDNVDELTAWWYDETTHRARKQGVTVSFDKAAGTATFVIEHCSAWGLFPVGFDPNLEKKPNADSSDDDDSDSDSSSGSSEADFSWASARSRMKSAKAGSTVRLGVPVGEKIPASLLRALAEKQDVTLVLRQNGKSLKILSSAVGDLEKKEYRFSELQALFGGQAASGSETAAEDADKTNPGTGASGHMGAALLLSACGLLIVRRLRG